MGIHIAIAIIFVVIGAVLGVVVTSCCVVAGRAGEQSEKELADKEAKNENR